MRTHCRVDHSEWQNGDSDPYVGIELLGQLKNIVSCQWFKTLYKTDLFRVSSRHYVKKMHKNKKKYKNGPSENLFFATIIV